MLVCFPRGQLSNGDKARLSKAGIVWVECDEPEKVVTLTPASASLPADEILAAALTAVTKASVGGANTYLVGRLSQIAEASVLAQREK